MEAPRLELQPSLQREARFPWKLFWVIGLSAVFMIGIVSYSTHTGYQLTAKYAPLVDSAMEIRLEATEAHLWLEEIIGGDESESFTKVIRHIDNAFWYAYAMLEGGQNQEGTFIPLTEPIMRAEIKRAIEELETFKKITYERYDALDSAKSGSAIDIRFDQTFRNFSESADRVETRLQHLIDSELKNFKVLQYLLIGACALISALIFTLFYRYEKRRSEDLRRIYESNAKLDRLSLTDGLTGIPNRRYFDAYLQKEWKRAVRDGSSISLVMLDIDFFKRFNDHYGHQEGDRCLKAVADCIHKSCQRPADIMARYGGEEFAPILPNTDHVAPHVQRIRAVIERLQIPHARSQVGGHVTVSIGCCTRAPGLEDSIEKLIRDADEALYRAKDQGRNRVEYAD